MNLKFKSTEADLKFNIQTQFRILNQNVLYLTREIDQIKKIVVSLEVEKNLQKQVDDYYQTPEDTRHEESLDQEPD